MDYNNFKVQMMIFIDVIIRVLPPIKTPLPSPFFEPKKLFFKKFKLYIFFYHVVNHTHGVEREEKKRKRKKRKGNRERDRNKMRNILKGYTKK